MLVLNIYHRRYNFKSFNGTYAMHQVFFTAGKGCWFYFIFISGLFGCFRNNHYICSTISKGLVDTSTIDKPGDPGHNVFKYEESIYSIHGFGG